MLIRNDALEQQGFRVDPDELVTPVLSQASAVAKGSLQNLLDPNWYLDPEQNPCASVGTPSSSYPSRSPSPERIVMSTEELRHSEASRKIHASQNLQGLIEAICAQRMEEGLQHQRATNASRARSARAIYERNVQK